MKETEKRACACGSKRDEAEEAMKETRPRKRRGAARDIGACVCLCVWLRRDQALKETRLLVTQGVPIDNTHTRCE